MAQLDNAADSDSEERGFESLWAGHEKSHFCLPTKVTFFNDIRSFRNGRYIFDMISTAVDDICLRHMKERILYHIFTEWKYIIRQRRISYRCRRYIIEIQCGLWYNQAKEVIL